MEKNEYFLRFQQMCINILAKSGNCEESQAFFRNATTVPELVSAWKRYWDGLLHEVPELVIDAFRKNYDIYRKDINSAGVYYNEVPPISAPPSIILIGDNDVWKSKFLPCFEIEGRHRVYVLGNMEVWAMDSCNLTVNSDGATVRLFDACRANVEKGKVIAWNRSIVSGKGYIICHDSATVKIFGGTVEDHGHLSIDAYNDAIVKTSVNKRITLHDNAKIEFI